MVENVETSLEVQVKFRIPQKVPSVVAQEMVIQPSIDGVQLSFFEIQLPIVTGKEMDAEQIKTIQESGVIAECVSKVFVPMSKFEGFVTALNETTSQIKKQREKIQQEFLKANSSHQETKENAKSNEND